MPSNDALLEYADRKIGEAEARVRQMEREIEELKIIAESRWAMEAKANDLRRAVERVLNDPQSPRPNVQSLLLVAAQKYDGVLP